MNRPAPGLVQRLLNDLSTRTMWNVEMTSRLDTRTLEYRWFLRANVARHVLKAFEAAIFDRPYQIVARRPEWVSVEVPFDTIEEARRMVWVGGPFAGARLD